MKCVRCGTDNKNSADYCIACETPLRFRRRSERYKKRKVVVTSIIVVVWMACFAFFFKDVLFPENPYSAGGVSERDAYDAEKEAARKKLYADLRAVQLAEQAAQAEKEVAVVEGEAETVDKASVTTSDDGYEIVSGTLSILDPWNNEVAKIRSALLGDGWLAMPARVCLGGTTWNFLSDAGEQTQVQGGSWRVGDPVGMWQVDQPLGNEKNVGVAVWNRTLPANWFSLESDTEVSDVSLSGFKNNGVFTIASLPANMNEVGIVVQGVDVVGWTFGQWISGAYLWNPMVVDAEARKQKISVRDFYNTTFADGREELFGMALSSLNEADPIKSISSFIDGFRVQPKLADSDTPYYLLADEIIKQMRALIKTAMRRGLEKQVVAMFDSTVLKLIGDINLLIEIVRPISRVYGYEAAIAAIEDSGSFIVQKIGVNVPELNEIHLSFYQDWLQALVTNGAIEEGDSVYLMARVYYGNDPYIHLLATELELLKGNWAEAERLLNQRSYPPELLDRFELLSRQISDLKSQEGNIVVRFQPGATRIPLAAALNGSHRQEFLVDTGASMVTIPSSAVEQLGLEIISGDHYDQRRVSTAGGIRMASEVIIDSLEIGGWVEYEVRALVMDIPEQPGLGLLGLNYLSRFSVDLRSEDGILSLTPR